MPIPMEVPARFLADVIAGQVKRYGCILKETGTGKIIGHLKEVGRAAEALAGMPLNPLSGPASLLAQAGQWVDTHAQLSQMKEALGRLQLIGTVGAVASVAGLGVSVA